jgi:hypothetical protein
MGPEFWRRRKQAWRLLEVTTWTDSLDYHGDRFLLVAAVQDENVLNSKRAVVQGKENPGKIWGKSASESTMGSTEN